MNNYTHITFVLCCLLALPPPHVMSQEWEYAGQRMAISFDGNSAPDHAYKWPTGDPDDWGASAASCAILAKEGLQQKLVHCSYNNFIDAPPGPDSLNQMKISLEGAAERWNFSPDVFFDVTLQLVAARNHLAAVMGKSTADDPLYFMHAGLSEFLCQAVEEVIRQGMTEALNHVYLISHSGFNEKEKRRPYHRDYEDVRKLCDDRIRYRKIPDQNAKEYPEKLWNSGSDFSVWFWMRDHSDANIRWMYSRMEVHAGGVADISDGGMLYFLLTGDEYGNPEKFRNFIGTGIPKMQE